jgi:hypothetical protein
MNAPDESSAREPEKSNVVESAAKVEKLLKGNMFSFRSSR